MLEVMMAFFIMFFIVVLCVAFLYIPVMIANARGIYGTEHTVIVVLSILWIFFGLTWFVALILSLVWGGECFTGDSLDKLEKLSRLYKDKVITKAEYERMKAKIMKE